MATLIPLPEGLESIEVSAKGQCIHVRKLEFSKLRIVASAVFLVCVVGCFAAAGYWAFVLVGFSSPLSRIVQPLCWLLGGGLIWGLGLYLLKPALFLESAVTRTPDGAVQITERFVGGWRRSLTLRGPVEFQVSLNWQDGTVPPRTEVYFYLHKVRLDAPGVLRYFGRSLLLIPECALVAGSTSAPASSHFMPGEETALQQSLPLGEAVARHLGIGVQYVRQGGPVLQ